MMGEGQRDVLVRKRKKRWSGQDGMITNRRERETVI